MYNLLENITEFWRQQIELYGDDLVVPVAQLQVQNAQEQPVNDQHPWQLEGNLESGILIIADSRVREQEQMELLNKILLSIELFPERVCMMTVEPEILKIDYASLLNGFLENSRVKYILCFGQIAAKLLKLEEPLERVRNRIFDYHSLRLMATHHPADLLNSKKLKYETWEDVKKFKEFFN